MSAGRVDSLLSHTVMHFNIILQYIVLCSLVLSAKKKMLHRYFVLALTLQLSDVNTFGFNHLGILGEE
jgi:hypothetical protein